VPHFHVSITLLATFISCRRAKLIREAKEKLIGKSTKTMLPQGCSVTQLC